jgi:hypothetical protein
METTIATKDRKAIETALESINASPVFRSSKQCQVLLRYIVEQTVADKDDLLRERVIGSEVFGRPHDYDTGNDPVVRSRVGELRKRLAQYYQEYAKGVEVSISIPNGSYRAVFQSMVSPTNAPLTSALPKIDVPEIKTEQSERHDNSEVNVQDPHVSTRSIRIRGLYTGILVLLLGCAVALAYRNHQKSQYHSDGLVAEFWRPLATSAKPNIIYIGANYAYRLSTPYLQAYSARQHEPYNGPEFFINLQRGESIPAAEIIPIKNVIGFGDVAATSRIVATLARFGAKYDLRYGEDLAVTDMKTAPVVLIGGFSNPWSLQLTDHLRFSLQKGDRVVDSQNGRHPWIATDGQDGRQPIDYVVVSRLANSGTGGFVLIIAGVGTVGNQAAADFISEPDALAKLLRNAPPGWETKNMQAVLSASYVRGIPITTEVKAVYFW